MFENKKMITYEDKEARWRIHYNKTNRQYEITDQDNVVWTRSQEYLEEMFNYLKGRFDAQKEKRQ